MKKINTLTFYSNNKAFLTLDAALIYTDGDITDYTFYHGIQTKGRDFDYAEFNINGSKLFANNFIDESGNIISKIRKYSDGLIKIKYNHVIKCFVTDKTVTTNEQISAIWNHEIIEADCSMKAAKYLAEKIDFLKNSGKEYMKFVRELNERFCSQVVRVHNKVPTVYLTDLAVAMTTAGGSVPAADELRVSYGALGTGTTAVAAGDTTLDTEVFRDGIDSQTSVGAIAYNTLFLGLTEANGNTLAEYGLFAGNASGSVDTGSLASRVLLSPTFAKTVAKTLTVDSTHTFSSAT